MKFNYYWILLAMVIILAIVVSANGQGWTELGEGVSYREVTPSVKSTKTRTYPVFYLKIDSRKVDLHMLTQAATGDYQTADGWAEEYDLNIVANMGMFDMSSHIPTGYTRVDHKEVNPTLRGSYKGVLLAFRKEMGLTDKANASRQQERRKLQYETHLIRMIADKQVVWARQPDKQWSTMCIGQDDEGMMYLIFSRSGYMVNTLAHEILRAVPEMKHVYYLEGGGEASLYVKMGSFEYKAWGSYESNVSEDDGNDAFYYLPNIIGIKTRKGL